MIYDRDVDRGDKETESRNMGESNQLSPESLLIPTNKQGLQTIAQKKSLTINRREKNVLDEQ